METDQNVVPMKKNRHKQRAKRRRSFIWLMIGLTFFAVILLIVFFSSNMSRVQTIAVSGNQLVPVEDILSASGIKQGDQFLFIWQRAIDKNVRQLGSIKTVRLHKTFPGDIRIEIEEYAKVAYMIGADERWEIVLANGKRLPTESGRLLDKPLLTGWSAPALANQLAKMAQSLSLIDNRYMSDLSEIVPAFTDFKKDRITIFTRSGYEVISSIEILPKRIQYLQGFIREIQAKKITDGYIHLDLKGKPYHTPYKKPSEPKKNDANTTQNEN